MRAKSRLQQSQAISSFNLFWLNQRSACCHFAAKIFLFNHRRAPVTCDDPPPVIESALGGTRSCSPGAAQPFPIPRCQPGDSFPRAQTCLRHARVPACPPQHRLPCLRPPAGPQQSCIDQDKSKVFFAKIWQILTFPVTLQV